jgi:hypothetical protein
VDQPFGGKSGSAHDQRANSAAAQALGSMAVERIARRQGIPALSVMISAVFRT